MKIFEKKKLLNIILIKLKKIRTINNILLKFYRFENIIKI